MLLSLVRNATINHDVTFPSLPAGIAYPPAWSHQVNSVLSEGLEKPSNEHALDKTVWAVVALDQVEFDLNSLTVTCIFTDGSCQQWPLPGACVQHLQHVSDDFDISFTMKEARLDKATYASDRPLTSFVDPFVISPAKQLPLLNPSRGQLVFTKLKDSRFFRSRACARLVDIYRQFVVGNLDSRVYTNGAARVDAGYAKWTAQSMLQRARGQMDFLVEIAVRDAFSRVRREATRELSLPWQEDDDDADTVSTSSTSSDGPSILTPIEGSPTSSSHPTSSVYHGLAISTHLRPIDYLSSEDFATYKQLSDLCTHLRSILLRIAIREAGYAAEMRNNYLNLELKARRRAWSNGSLRSRANFEDINLGSPIKSSPLAWCIPITAGTNSNDSIQQDRAEFNQDLMATSPLAFLPDEDDLEVTSDYTSLPPPLFPKDDRSTAVSGLSQKLEELSISKRSCSQRARIGVQSPRMATTRESMEHSRRSGHHVPRNMPLEQHPCPSSSDSSGGAKDLEDILPTLLHGDPAHPNVSCPQDKSVISSHEHSHYTTTVASDLPLSEWSSNPRGLWVY